MKEEFEKKIQEQKNNYEAQLTEAKENGTGSIILVDMSHCP